MDRVEATLAAQKIEVAETKRGRVWAKCPYHDPDLHPSWCIRVTSERYGQHYCFACKAGGHLVQLVEHALKLTRADAEAWLEKLGASEQPVEPEPMPELLRLVTAPLPRGFRLPREVILEPLERWVTPARLYAVRRGITPEQVRRWALGYAVDGRLAGRVVLPIFEHGSGRVASYTARTFANDPKRYLYPSGADHPNLDAMFGELAWPAPSQRRNETVVVVEGGIDALSVERVRSGPVAAMGGSKLRAMHLGKLATFGHVVVMSDSDLPGDAVAAELAGGLARWSRVTRVRLPAGKDATSLAPEELKEWLSGI